MSAKKPYAIHFTPDDFKERRCTRLGVKRRESVSNIRAGRSAIISVYPDTIVFPLEIREKDFTFAVPNDFVIATVFDRNGELNGITLQQDGHQRTFTRHGSDETFYTLNGEGVGETVRSGRAQSIETLCSSNPIAAAAREWLRRKTS